MTKIFSTLNEGIEIGADVVRILKKLADRDGALLDDLADALTGGTPSADLQAQLTANQQDLLARFYGKLADEVDLNEHFRALLSPVSELDPDGPLAWSWVRSRQGALPRAGDLSFKLGGSVDLSAVILPAPTYRLHGRLAISGSALAPFRFASVGLSAEAGGGAELEASFVHPANTRLLNALIEDLPLLTDLNDLGKLQSPFHSAKLSLDGEIKLSASLKAGKTFVVERAVGGAAVSASVELGASYQVDWAKSGSYALTVSRGRDGSIGVRVKEVHEHETARTLSIGADVQFSNIDNAVAPLMKEISGFAAPVEKLVKKYSQPSKLIKKQLLELVSGQHTKIQQLAEVVTGQRRTEVFVSDLTDTIAEEAGTRLDGFLELLDGEVDQVVASVLTRLNVPSADAQARLEVFVAKAAEDAIAKLRKSMLDDLRELLASNESAAVDALSDFAGDVQSWSGTIDRKSARLLAPLQKAVNRYREIQQSLSDAIEAIEKEKLAIRFGRAVMKRDRQELLVDLTLHMVDTATRGWYRKMLTGDFSVVLAAALDGQDPRVTLNDCVFSKVFARTTTTGVTVNLFGMGEVGFSRILHRELAVKAQAGQIALAQGSGAAEDVAVFFDESRTVKVSSLVNLLDADNRDDNALQVYAAYVDGQLHRSELREHLMAFERRGLIAAGATERAVRAFSTEDASQPIQVVTAFSLGAGEVDKIAGMSEAKIGDAALRVQVESLQQYDEYKRYLRDIQRRFNHGDVAAVIRHFRGERLRDIEIALGGRSPKNHRRAHLIRTINDNSDKLIEYFELWKDLKATRLPRVEPSGKLNETQFKKLETLHDEMIEAIEGWSKASGFIREVGGSAFSTSTLAFLMVLAQLTGRDQQVVPIMSWKAKARTRRIAVV